MLDPHIQILAKYHVMSEGHPVNLEMCTLSKLMFHLKIPLYTKFHVDLRNQILAKLCCHVRGSPSHFGKNYPFQIDFLHKKNPIPKFSCFDHNLQPDPEFLP